MSFMPARMMMSLSREYDFSGATKLSLFYDGDITSPLDFSIYSVTVKDGFDSVAVDWGDGTVECLTPDPTTRKVQLIHSYSSREPRTVKIQNHLDSLVFSNISIDESRVYAYVIGVTDRFEGARALSAVLALGSNVTSRTLSPGLFARTSISSYPSVYSLPPLSSTNTLALCIPFGCFYDCPRLSNLDDLPSGLKAIDAYAFAHCTSLSSVAGLSGSPNLKHIGFMAFGKCTSLQTLTGLTATLHPTPSNLFGGNLGLPELMVEMFHCSTIASSQVSLRYRMNLFMFPIAPLAFYGCTSLTDLAGLSVETDEHIPPGAFQGCSSLSVVPSSIKDAHFATLEYRKDASGANYHAVAYGLPPANALSIDTYAYYVGSGHDYGRFDPQMEMIRVNGAFSGTAVTEFIGLNSVRSVFGHNEIYRSIFGSQEFADCPNVTSMVFSSSTTPLNFMGDTFSGCTNLKSVSFPNHTKSTIQNDVWKVTDVSFGGYNSSSYPFGLPSGCIIHCSDGDLTVA